MATPIQFVLNKMNNKTFTRMIDLFQGTDISVPVFVVINTFGGSVHIALAMYDLILAERCKGRTIVTIAVGSCMSAGNIVLAAASIRYATNNTIFMMHNASLSLNGSATSETLAQDQKYLAMCDHLGTKTEMAHVSEKNKRKLLQLIEKEGDFFFNPNEALKFGLITDIGFPVMTSTQEELVVNCMEFTDDE